MTAEGSADPLVDPLVLIVGDVIDDVIVRPRGPVTRGSDTASVITPSLGGSGANQAVWLAANGTRVRFAGRVGAADVDRHTAAFAQAGVEARLSGDDAASTGAIVIIVDPDDGERTMYTDRGANLHLREADLADGLLLGVDLLHISGYSFFDAEVRRSVLDLLERAHAAGVSVSVDPASVAFLEEAGPDRFLGWIAGTRVLLPNLDEGRCLTRQQDPDRILEALLEHVPLVALKLGGEGAIVGERGGQPIRVPAGAGTVIDTTGAGDAFCGALLAGLVRRPLDRHMVEVAVEAGTRAAGSAGGRPRPQETSTSA